MGPNERSGPCSVVGLLRRMRGSLEDCDSWRCQVDCGVDSSVGMHIRGSTGQCIRRIASLHVRLTVAAPGQRRQEMATNGWLLKPASWVIFDKFTEGV